MRRAGALVALFALCGGSARAEDAPVVTQRVDRRFVQKTGHAELSLGLAYLSRGDFYRNIGLEGTFSYWTDESVALEAQAALYHAGDTDATEQVKRDLGFVPNAHREQSIVTVGGRWSIAYGKALVGKDSIVHFDPQVFAHAGMHSSEDGIGPMADVGLALGARPKPWLELRLDFALVLQAEDRKDGWAAILGYKPLLSVGFML